MPDQPLADLRKSEKRCIAASWLGSPDEEESSCQDISTAQESTHCSSTVASSTTSTRTRSSTSLTAGGPAVVPRTPRTTSAVPPSLPVAPPPAPVVVETKVAKPKTPASSCGANKPRGAAAEKERGRIKEIVEHDKHLVYTLQERGDPGARTTTKPEMKPGSTSRSGAAPPAHSSTGIRATVQQPPTTTTQQRPAEQQKSSPNKNSEHKSSRTSKRRSSNPGEPMPSSHFAFDPTPYKEGDDHPILGPQMGVLAKLVMSQGRNAQLMERKHDFLMRMGR